MRILVCVKQVPDTDKLTVDPVRHTLRRDGVPGIVNPFDAAALQAAVALRGREGGLITALCMGPAQARQALRTCLAGGADEAVLLCDELFSGSDTLATSKILAAAVGELERRQGVPFDLLLCGRQTLDGDTGQVGPELAEQLGYVSVTNVMDLTVEGKMLRAAQRTDVGLEVLQTVMPCVVCIARLPEEAAVPSLSARLTAARADVTVLDAEALGLDKDEVGLSGSPTRVVEVFAAGHRRAGVMLKEGAPAEKVQELVAFIKRTLPGSKE